MKSKDRKKIEEWLDRARQEEKSHLLVVENEFKGIRFPVFVDRQEELKRVLTDHEGLSKVRVVEVYSTSFDPSVQLNNERNWVE